MYFWSVQVSPCKASGKKRPLSSSWSTCWFILMQGMTQIWVIPTFQRGCMMRERDCDLLLHLAAASRIPVLDVLGIHNVYIYIIRYLYKDVCIYVIYIYIFIYLFYLLYLQVYGIPVYIYKVETCWENLHRECSHALKSLPRTAFQSNQTLKRSFIYWSFIIQTTNISSIWHGTDINLTHGSDLNLHTSRRHERRINEGQEKAAGTKSNQLPTGWESSQCGRLQSRITTRVRRNATRGNTRLPWHCATAMEKLSCFPHSWHILLMAP